MTSESIIAITLLAASALTSGFFAYMHSLRRQAYLMLWSAGWCLLALHYLSPALEPWMAVAPWQTAVNEWLLAAAALLFFSTAQVYTNTRAVGASADRRGRVFALWSAAYLSACGQYFAATRRRRGACGDRLGLLPGKPAPRNFRGFAAGRFVPQLERDPDRRAAAQLRASPIRCARWSFCPSCSRRL